jgi:hypothetical protein
MDVPATAVVALFAESESPAGCPAGLGASSSSLPNFRSGETACVY